MDIVKSKKQQNNDNGKKNFEKKIHEMAFTIDKVEDEKLEVENQLKRALADYDNLVKNSEKRDELRFFQIKKNLCEQLIPSLDSIVLAVDSSKDVDLDDFGKSWLNGILAILDTINKSLEGIGLKQYIPNKGEFFDSGIHEAVATAKEGEKGKIYDIVQPGYILNDSVIRPARVVVSK